MIWPARVKPLVAVPALILVIAGVAVQGRQRPAPKGAREEVKATPQAALPRAGSAAAGLPDVATSRALARKQLALIDETWAFLEEMAKYGRVEIDGGTLGPWGRRRLEALRKAGAGKAEIVAALDKYINDLERMQAIVEARENRQTARIKTPGNYEVRFLRMEAEIWLNEEKAR
jgi:hypothetical protein